VERDRHDQQSAALQIDDLVVRAAPVQVAVAPPKFGAEVVEDAARAALGQSQRAVGLLAR
jgi:hypothetical protein